MADTWLSRILAVECQHAPVGRVCFPMALVGHADAVCASRIQAAEGAARARLDFRHKFPRMDITWQHGRWTKTCEQCGALTSGERGHAFYSHDNGATWTPGPDPCPGRPSTPEPRKER